MSPWLCGATSVCSVPGVAQYRVPPGVGSQGMRKSQHTRAGLQESQDGAESGASYPCSCSLPPLLGFSLLSQLLPHPPLGSLPAPLCSSQRRSWLTFRTPSGLCVCVTALVPWALWVAPCAGVSSLPRPALSPCSSAMTRLIPKTSETPRVAAGLAVCLRARDAVLAAVLESLPLGC